MRFLEPCDDKRVLRGQLVVTFLWAAITACGIYLRPDSIGHGTHQQLGLPPCPSVLIFGRPCHGCGLTTSWTATIHGRFVEAFAAHPLGPILYALFTFFAVLNVYAYCKRLYVSTSGRKWAIGLAIGALTFFGFGLYRFATHPNYASAQEIGNYVQRFAPK